MDKNLESQIDLLYARQKEQGATTVSREEFGKLYQPTKLNDTDSFFGRIEKARKLNADSPTAAKWDTVTDTGSNLNQREKEKYDKVQKALDLPTFAPKKPVTAPKAIVNLSREQEEEIKAKVIKAAKIKFEAEKNKALNLKNGLPKDLSPLERILLEKGWA